MQKPSLLCSAKTVTTTPGKLGRAVGFSTRASRAGDGTCTVTGFCRVLHYWRFLYISSILSNPSYGSIILFYWVQDSLLRIFIFESLNHLVNACCNVGLKLTLTLLAVDYCHIRSQQPLSSLSVLSDPVSLDSGDRVNVGLLPLVQAIWSVTELGMSSILFKKEKK